MFYFLLLLPLLLSQLLLIKANANTNQIIAQVTQNSLNNAVFDNYNGDHIVAMVNDYTLINKVSIPNVDLNNITIFSLQRFKEKEKEKEGKEINGWFSYFIEKGKEKEPFESRVQTKVDLLNRVIINATDGLLKMCDKMIEKTTSVLPLSYSYKFVTDIALYSSVSDDPSVSLLENTGNTGFLGFFSSTPKSSKELNKVEPVTKKKEDIDLDEIELEVMKDLYDYQMHRIFVNNRQAFLNSLCSNTFEPPYILYYNPDDNTLLTAVDPNPIDHYTIIIQNIIDNSLVRNLNRGFKDQMNDKKSKKNDKRLRYDIELDIDIDKTASLKEKAIHILPILQKLSWKLPTYLSDIAKRSLNIDEYFHNLNQFWNNILNETIIGLNDLPITFKLELDVINRLAEKDNKAKIAADLLADLEAQKIIDDYKKKAQIDDARDFVRQSDILLKERQQNFSDKEWEQFNLRFSKHISGAIGIYDTTIGGLGQLLHSTLSIPANVVVNFASTQVSQIGKLLILVAGVLIVGLMTLFFTKMFIRRVTKLFWSSDK